MLGKRVKEDIFVYLFWSIIRISQKLSSPNIVIFKYNLFVSQMIHIDVVFFVTTLLAEKAYF